MVIKKIKVLLINPPTRRGKYGRGDFFTPPMGLTYIASVLMENNIPVEIIDCDPEKIYIDFFSPKRVDINHLYERLKTIYPKPLIIGIGPCTTPFLTNALSIAKYIKNYYSSSFLIMGGPHVSLDPPKMAEKMLREFAFIDALAIGEGEKTMLDIVTAFLSKKAVHDVKGIVMRKADSITYIQREPLSSKEYEDLPFPARDLIQKYSPKYKLAIRRTFNKIISDPKLLKKYGESPKFSVIFSSRGCPFKCAFCCSSKKRKLRSPESVVEEIQSCIEKYDTYCFVFYDDLFTTASSIEAERVSKLCELIIEKGLKIFWEVELRADIIYKLDKNVLKKMNNAGCYIINIGIEKGTNSGLKFLEKGLTVEIIKKAIDKLRTSGDFTINGTFILGGENETRKDIMTTIKFSQSLKLDYASFYLLEIHPATKIFQIAKQKSLIDDILKPYINPSKQYPIFTNNYLSLKNLKELQLVAFRLFYLRKNKIEQLYSKLKSINILTKQYYHFFEHCFVEDVR